MCLNLNVQEEFHPPTWMTKKDIKLFDGWIDKEENMSHLPADKLPFSRRKALSAALNSIESNVGNSIFKNQNEDRILQNKLHKLDRSFKRSQLHLQQQKKFFLFIKDDRTINPTVIMERGPPSGINEYETSNLPRYMQNLKSKTSAPKTLPTMDAFFVPTRKKKNIWEYGLEESLPEIPKFQSVTSSAPLTDREKRILRRGFTFHKEHTDSNLARAIRVESDSRKKPIPFTNSRSSNGRISIKEDSTDYPESVASSSIFITQSHHSPGTLERRVSFNDDIKVTEFDQRSCTSEAARRKNVKNFAENSSFPPIKPNPQYSGVKPKYNAPPPSAGSPSFAILNSATRGQSSGRTRDIILDKEPMNQVYVKV